MKKLIASTIAMTIMAFVPIASAGGGGGGPADDDATCNISCSVNGIMEWAGDFPDIDLGAITASGEERSGWAAVDLYTNGDVDISADTAAAARLDHADGDTLETTYSLSFDGDGSSATGGASVSFTGFATFLDTASAIDHVNGDGAVSVTLGVKATADSDAAPDAGLYSATQTLTAAWAD